MTKIVHVLKTKFKITYSLKCMITIINMYRHLHKFIHIHNHLIKRKTCDTFCQNHFKSQPLNLFVCWGFNVAFKHLTSYHDMNPYYVKIHIAYTK